MTVPEKPGNLRIRGALAMAFATLMAWLFVYVATEVYPSRGWVIGRFEGAFFGPSVEL